MGTRSFAASVGGDDDEHVAILRDADVCSTMSALVVIGGIGERDGGGSTRQSYHLSLSLLFSFKKYERNGQLAYELFI